MESFTNDDAGNIRASQMDIVIFSDGDAATTAYEKTAANL
jgi:hypothetical protein